MYIHALWCHTWQLYGIGCGSDLERPTWSWYLLSPMAAWQHTKHARMPMLNVRVNIVSKSTEIHDLHDFTWRFHDFYMTFTWFHIIWHDFYIVSHDFTWLLHGFTCFHITFTWLYIILRDFYMILHDFTWHLHEATLFYISFIWFYMILHDVYIFYMISLHDLKYIHKTLYYFT